MEPKKAEIKSIRWWVMTKGCFTPKSHYDPAKNGEAKYYILEAQKKHLDKQSGRYFWLDTLVVHDKNFQESDFWENGVKGKITSYDNLRRQVTCYITDLKGESKPIQFSGDILAITRCINYMQQLSEETSWVEFELKTQKQKILTQAETIKKLRKEVCDLKDELNNYTKEDQS